jgi:hypothetical protein
MLASSAIENRHHGNDFEPTDQLHRLLTVQAKREGRLFVEHEGGPLEVGADVGR